MGVAKLHDAGANLHGVASEKDEFGSIATGFDATDGGEGTAGEFFANEGCDFHHHAEGDGFDRFGRVAAGGGVAFYGGHGAEAVEVDSHHGADGVDGGDTFATIGESGSGGVLDVSDVRGHFCPDGNFGDLVHPRADFAEDIRVLAHGGAHLAFGKAVGAGEVEFEGIDTGVLATLGNFAPRVFVELFHDGSDEHSVGIFVFALLEFVEPFVERAVADELDVFPADHFLAVVRFQFGIAGTDVDDFGSVEADGLGDDAAPAFFKCSFDDADVGSGRAGSNDERVGHLDAVDGCFEGSHSSKC